MDKPNISQASRDDVTISMSSLGRVGRVRLYLSLVIIRIGMALTPREVGKAMSSQRMVPDDGEE